MKRNIVLGALVAATAALTLHAGETATHWELHAFADVDGVRKIDKRIMATNFNGPEGCIQAALSLGSPPPAKQINGHNVIYGYVCTKVEDDAQTTQVF